MTKYLRLRPADIGAAAASTEALTFPVDYNDGTAIDPPTGTIFTNQQQIDRLLAANSTSNFKHVQAVLDALPILRHDVVVTCAAGIHRPATAGALVIDHASFLDGGSLTIDGDPTVSTWTPIHAGGTITGHQTLDEVTSVNDPYLDFALSTFPNDGSLQGKYAILSNGFLAVIWDHTDSRLWLCNKLAPVPIDGVTTCFVGEPSTVFQNSLDGVARSNSGSAIILKVAGASPVFLPLLLNNITVQDFSAGSPVLLSGEEILGGGSNFHIDKVFGPIAEDGQGLRTQGGMTTFWQGFSFLSTVGSGADVGVSVLDSEMSLLNSYVQGGDDGNDVVGTRSLLTMRNSVFRGCGGDAFGGTNRPGLITDTGGSFNVWEINLGVITTFLDTPNGGPALQFRDGGSHFPLAVFGSSSSCRFRDNTGPGIRINSSLISLAGASAGFLDDGGNLDVGIEIVGPYGSAILTADTDVTGANGDIRFADDIETYANLVADGPFVDPATATRLEQV